MPVIGFLNVGSPDLFAARVAALKQGVNETGHIVGRNVAIEYRWAEDQYDRLPALAADRNCQPQGTGRRARCSGMEGAARVPPWPWRAASHHRRPHAQLGGARTPLQAPLHWAAVGG